ncbi:PKD domain-containing protein [Pseudopedobacter beijingensis]|uniref:PKD domain-containing protein n=1 Tax=Pseudopedobacter beijingensis TaxID=1207056 RepID=A0ABW4IAG8_9SPHI
MKNIKRISSIFLLAVLSLLSNACKKNETTRLIDLLYDLDVEGNDVKFNLVTESVTDYRWDFGDGQTSNEANPTHTYPGKGKYVATLYAKVNGQAAESSAVIRIAKSSPIKIGDNSLADWDNITNNVITSGPGGGVVKKAKFDYDGNNIYIYMELESKKSNGDIFDFYIDSDNNTSTGLLGGFPDGGFDVLLEGALLTEGLDVFYHKGEQTSFSFDQQSISDFYQVGTIVQDGNILKFEMKLVRTKLKWLTGTGAKFGIMVTKNDWSQTIGFAPDENASAFFLDMDE